ncbi:MAG: primosomal protein N' (replication factor Y) [Chlamydiales bacterium]|jgi:primosomal protein N' (replication factor Y)
MPGGDRQAGLFPEAEPEPTPAAPPKFEHFASVAVQRPVRTEFTYGVPSELAVGLSAGMRVSVPFGRRREIAVVVGMSDQTELDPKRVKSILAVLDTEPIVDRELLELTRWMGAYYACSWGECLAAVLPSALKRDRARQKVLMARVADGIGATELATLDEKFPKQHRFLRTLLDLEGPSELNDLLRRLGLSDSPARTLARKGWVHLERVEVKPDEVAPEGVVRERPEQLMPEQETAVERIGARVAADEYATFLLWGVTGSGKTEVYLRVIEDALARGKGAIVLVPEIALTPQTVGWFRSRFGEVGVFHSRMTDAQRLDMWLRTKRGEVNVVVGARSAVFAPVQNLGVIVVDEEHEPSFKQGNVPRYGGRDVAVRRAQTTGAVCVLGSATPSLESWVNAQSGRYELLELSRRVNNAEMPTVEIVDMRHERSEGDSGAIFSRLLITRLTDAFARGEQAILFLNRRGFAPVLWCRACGETVRCGQCDMSLNFHRRIGRLVCHVCCDEQAAPKACPSCTAPALRYLGVGSERVEAVVKELFPEARVRRMDSDTMLRRTDYEETLSAFGRGEVDMLVGTQMIAKGLDFPRVTVVGVVSADATLHLPDFRAAERTFQLLSQVSGRAGRGSLKGIIVVQTVTPEHPSIVQAASHNFEAFASAEQELRRELSYPPFGRLIRVVFDDEEEQRVTTAARSAANILCDELLPQGIDVLGPAPAPVALQRGRHRQHILLKAPEGTNLARAREVLAQFATQHARPRISIDVDPVSML